MSLGKSEKASETNPMNALAVTMIVMSLFLGGVVGYILANTSLSPRFNPTIDGTIGCEEYANANWKIEQYFDVNNTNGDVDAINYLYIGQDDNYVYVTVDLVSDTTNSTDDEWFGVWLNTNNRTFGGWNESWYSFRNNGTENMVYDVMNEQIKPYASDTIIRYNLWQSNSSSFESTINYGSIVSGSWADTQYDDGSVCITESGIDGTSNKILYTFSFDISDYFGMLPDYEDELLASITEAQINLTSFLSFAFWRLDETDITETKVYIENNGTYNNAPLDMDKTSPDIDNNIININNSAFSDGVLNFQIQLKNNTLWYLTQMFHFWIDSLRITFKISQSDLIYGTSTITNNYTLGIGFGASCNSQIPHRMYEFKVKKTILENFTNTGTLGIYVQGGGLEFESNDIYYFGSGHQKIWFWFFLLWDESMPDWSVNYYYVKFE